MKRRNTMKKGEYYRHKWNKYVSRITDVKRDKVQLEIINSGVVETIRKENFEDNYTPCTTIYDWECEIQRAFPFGVIKLMGDTIRVDVDDSRIEFSIDYNGMLKAQYSDDIKEAIDTEYNVTRFLLEDANDVIELFANLFE